MNYVTKQGLGHFYKSPKHAKARITLLYFCLSIQIAVSLTWETEFNFSEFNYC